MLLFSLLFMISCIMFKVQGYLEKPSVVTYWGQNSRRGLDSQKRLSTYCDESSDAIILSFLLNFKDGSLPTLNLANSCTGPAFQGTTLLQCTDIGKDIKTCQKKGKTILLSLGGDSGAYGFSNDKDAESFADTIWNLFGAGESKTRPFGDAIVDGFDLDIEGGGPTGYPAMMKRLRAHYAKDRSKAYYITGSPQCPYPDVMLENALNEGKFDAIHVQFYNNYCSTTSSQFNFESWDTWAKKTSRNNKVKVLLGLPGSDKAANSGYVPFSQLKPIINKLHFTYSSFGGVMIWDASASYGNQDVSPNYQAVVAKLIHGFGNGHSTDDTIHTNKPSSRHAGHSSTTTKHMKTRSRTVVVSTQTHPSTITKRPVLSSKGHVEEGKPCSPSGSSACSGSSFATCSNGKWILFACPSGLKCLSAAGQPQSVYCGQSKSHERKKNYLVWPVNQTSL